MPKVAEARGFRDHAQFWSLPLRLHRHAPAYVPAQTAYEFLVSGIPPHPFYAEGRRRCFLARRNGRVVGRVAAIRNPAHERAHGDRCGFFGFFDVRDSGAAGVETTRALLRAAREALAAWGLGGCVGPVNPSLHYPSGVRLGHPAHAPGFMLPYTPARYDELLRGAGLVKARDLLVLRVSPVVLPDRLRALGARVTDRMGVRIRAADVRRPGDLAAMQRVFAEGWRANWGFTPLEPGEFALKARGLRWLAQPWSLQLAEIRGTAVGFSLSLPDYNELLVHCRPARPTLAGLRAVAGFLAGRRRYAGLRAVALGVTAPYARTGLGLALAARSLEEAAARGFTTADGSWILEDNRPMLRIMAMIGATVAERYRLYRLPDGSG